MPPRSAGSCRWLRRRARFQAGWRGINRAACYTGPCQAGYRHISPPGTVDMRPAGMIRYGMTHSSAPR
ncbi:hypothetical protein LHGZ1_2318 [Laribacter hongkongensis]|uniref:Uncharacterized protein n=1 Tax=Laribacter hongkongensis TaxID=168471 RepID=A0A248LKX1_9NEIS|nr:hypothetical protein LHGZ1_2318 [Laribacter hongkongensis]